MIVANSRRAGTNCLPHGHVGKPNVSTAATVV
jgi:hypothetical protein